MSGKEEILSRIRQNKPGFSPLPDINSTRAKNPGQPAIPLFKENLVKAGAKVVEVTGRGEVSEYIRTNFSEVIDFEIPVLKEKYSPGCPKDTLGTIQAVVLEGQFGVAENGAIWFDDSNFPNRLVPFITKTLIVKLDKSLLANTMEEAYKKLNLDKTGFGVFISGPSKTADIEQSLVYGAHGAKEMYAILY